MGVAGGFVLLVARGAAAGGGVAARAPRRLPRGRVPPVTAPLLLALLLLALPLATVLSYPTASDGIPRGSSASLPYGDYHTREAAATPGRKWASAYDGAADFLGAARGDAARAAAAAVGGVPEEAREPPAVVAGLASSAWPMARGGPRHSGRQETFDSSGRRGRRIPAVQWTFDARAALTSSPVLGADGSVYVGARDGFVYAVNASSGLERWRYLTGGPVLATPVVGNPIGTDQSVYVPSSDGECHAISTRFGTFRYRFVRERLHLGGRWALRSPEPLVSSPVLGEDGTAFLGGSDGNVYALNTATGAGGATGSVKWTFPTAAPVTSSPALANGRILVGTLDGELYALDADSGDRLWSYRTGGAVHSSPAVSEEGRVFVGSFDGFLYCLNATSGELLWRFRTAGGVYSSPALDGNETSVFVGSTDRMLYSVAVDDGLLRWNATLVREASLLRWEDGREYPQGFVDIDMWNITVNETELALAERAEELAAELAAANATTEGVPADLHARPRLEYESAEQARDSMFAALLEHEGVCPPMTASGSDAALDRRLGMQPAQACRQRGVGVHSSPVFAGGVVFVGSEDRSMYAVDADSGRILWAFPTNGAISASALVTDDHRLIFGAEDGVLYSLLL